MPILAPILLVAQVTVSAPQQPAAELHRRPLFISPMGEPFRNRSGDALADWFNQADLNHDGQLTLDEMQKDAERFFAVLDVGRDGEIDPDDVTRYENVVAPEVGSGPHLGLAMMDPSGGDRPGGGRGGRHHGGSHHHWGGGGGGESLDGHQGAARYGLLDLPEPVVSADSDFNRGVSLNEFRQAAGQRFIALDLNHRGRLTLAELETIRPAPAAQPNKEVIPGQTPTSEDSGPPIY
jgi:hypothetical protein